MKVAPKDAGINYDTRAKLLEHHEEVHGSVDDSIKENITKSHEEQGNITFIQALKIPNVLNYAIIYMNCKGIVYAIIFWLPTYLINTLQFSTVFYQIIINPKGSICLVTSPIRYWNFDWSNFYGPLDR
jgi:hypothetical protein